jgi:hypothetical protein
VAADEIEVEWAYGELRCGVRHHLTPESWDIRAWVANDSPAAVALAQTALKVEPGDGLAWVWPAASAGVIALVAAEAQPVGLRTRLGELWPAAGESARSYQWVADGLIVEPGQRTVFSAQGRANLSWADLGGLVPHWIPRLAGPPGSVIELDQPDAVTVAPGAQVEDIDGHTYIIGQGHVDVVVATQQGRVHLDTYFARDLDAAATDLAQRWLDPYFPAADVGAALVVASRLPQLARSGLREVADVLVERGAERLAALLDGDTPLSPTEVSPTEVSPTEVAFLVAGLDEWGFDVTAAAGESLAAWLDRTTPAGLGLALVRLGHHRLLDQRDLTWIRALVGAAGDSALAPDWLAALEWRLVRGEAPTPPELERLMVLVGAGLPGDIVQAVADLPVTDVHVARGVAVATLLDERFQVPGQWPVTLGQAAELARWRILACLGNQLTAAAWLALGLAP